MPRLKPVGGQLVFVRAGSQLVAKAFGRPDCNTIQAQCRGSRRHMEFKDPRRRAMKVEIAANWRLRVPWLLFSGGIFFHLQRYFIEYLIDEADIFAVAADLGGLLSRRHDRFRAPEVHVRVGDYKFDNTNYVGSGVRSGSRYDLERFPLENAYPVLRRYLWLETDSAYKSAVEAISRKRAALRNLMQSEQVDDFARAEPVRLVRDFSKLMGCSLRGR